MLEESATTEVMNLYIKTARQAVTEKNYSRNLKRLIKKVIALYDEFKELLKPGEEVDVYAVEGVSISWKLNRIGVNIGKGKVIPVKEYVEKILPQRYNDDRKLSELELLIRRIRELEKDEEIELEGKYFEYYL